MDINDVVYSLEHMPRPSGTLKAPIFCIYEDIDTIVTDRNDSKEKDYRKNFNNLLQVLDGYLSVPYTINIATTNHIEKLDEAITRAGRFDLQIELKGLTEDLAKKMCDKHKVSYDILDDEEFPINPSYLQTKIIANKRDSIQQ